MADTIHEAPGRAAPGELRLKGTTLSGVDLGTAALEAATKPRAKWPVLRRLLLGAVLFIASYGAGLLIFWLAMHRGHGTEVTPLSVILFVALVLAFGIPEVALAARRIRPHSKAWATNPPTGG